MQECSFHPSQNLLAVGLVDGQLQLLNCGLDDTTVSLSSREHTDSCRAVTFNQSGSLVVSGSADKAIVVRDVQEEKILSRLSDSHDAAVSRLESCGEKLFASGDEEGVIRTWDWRQKGATSEFSMHKEYISDMTYWGPDSCLAAVSGDGCLSINDLKSGKVRAMSAGDADDELTSLAVLKAGKKVICGSQTGVLNIFSWGDFSGYSDRFPGHPNSVDAIVKVDEDTVITGSSDGVLRILSVQPHALMGILGQHDEFGCETIALSHDHRMLASTSFGPAVRLWDTSCLDENAESPDAQVTETVLPVKADESASDEEQPAQKKQKREKKKSAKNVKSQVKTDFFKDLL